jgi:hypothetical protein
MKNAPKNLLSNPAVGITTHDIINDLGLNKAGNARKFSLTFLAGAPEKKSAKIKEDGKEKTVEWTVLGTVDLQGTFVIDGVECKLSVTKKFGKIPQLEIRAVTASASSEGSAAEL